MQVSCPWCRQTIEVPEDASLPGSCPGCGRSLTPLHTTLPDDTTLGHWRPGFGEEGLPPTYLGRYRITGRIGSGGFGVVYKGHDDELGRDVAIKVPHRQRLTSPQDADVYLTEGRVLARLDHPAIVPVYDVGRADDGLCYLVSKFIEGCDLAHRLDAGRPSQEETAGILASIAEALHHAHQRGLIHRDVKPANILLDVEGRAYVTDFGLALREEDFARGPTFAGTPMYMSPEQARGEGHRVDGRTDVFSLGIVFYEALTGQLPFQGQTVEELLGQIATREVEPPHQLDPAIAPELERICLKALSKRAADRYATAETLAEDLRHWLETLIHPAQAQAPAAPGTLEPARVVPKGLRAFDAPDADYFLELLPGPRDREGLPASIRFWKPRIDSSDPATTFAVGLIYGPSGCGKSSLVRAGLLPRLAPRVTTVYVESAPEGTERRVLGGLWHACPDLAGEMELPAVLADLRRGKALGTGRKLLIVLDQFEQFLHGQGEQLAASPLVAALRQADGVRVQFLLLVRDDFWLAASRLFQELEIPLLEGHNLELIDLFEPKHARHVLQLFGQAYDCLPADPKQMTPEQQAFLDEAVAGLCEDGKVISVRLSLFAEMMKKRPWTPRILEAVGGTQGVGSTFLHETFSAPTARPDRRASEQAARGILAALLPEAGSNIKGRIRSRAELLQAASLQGHPHRFERLLDLLDRELRIITPTEGVATDAGRGTGDRPSSLAPPPGSFNQLTHDFLVPPLREWLTQRQRATWRGRAELHLEERTAQWTRSAQDRFLPSPLEYAGIMLAVPRRRRTPEQQTLLWAATRHYGTLAATLLALVALLGWWTWEFNGRLQGARVAEAIEYATPGELSRIIQEELPRYRRWANARLHLLADREKTLPSQRLRASLALVGSDPRQVDYLSRRLLDCGPDEFPLVRDGLEKHVAQFENMLWQVLRDSQRPAGERFRAGQALAEYVNNSDQWTDADADFLVQQLLRSNRDDQRELRARLANVSGRLLHPLQRLCADPAARGDLRLAAADALADYAHDQPDLLARLVSEATAEQYDVLQAALARLPESRTAAVSMLRALVSEQPPSDATEAQRVPIGQRRAGAAITLLHLGERESARAVFQFQDDPEALTQFIHRLKDRRLPPQVLLNCLDEAGTTAARFALILSLGEFGPVDLPAARRRPLLDRLAEWYRSDPSSAIHGACGWLLRAWGRYEEVERVDRTPLPLDGTGRRDWFVEQIGPDYLTFIVFAPGSYLMGSPASEGYRLKNERQHRVRLTRPFAVADRELTRGQFERFLEAEKRKFVDIDEASPTAEHPVVRVTWSEAVLYCRWLTREAGREGEQCYDLPSGAREKGKDGPPKNWPFHPERQGCRLPTEAEWEYACRAGTTTTYSFGSDRGLLHNYGRFLADGAEVGGTLRPNLRGLFDMQGNVWEWCEDWYEQQLADDTADPQGATEGVNRVLRGGGWDRSAWHCRAAYRHSPTPDYRGPYIGFRLVRTLPQ